DVENKINYEKQWYDDWCKPVWGRDRATDLKAEDIAEACEANNNNDNAVLSSSSDTEDEVFVVPGIQNPPAVPSTSQTKKNKKLSPPTESSYKKKKSLTLEQIIDAKLDDANKSESVSEDTMQEVMNVLINIGISHFDIGKVVEFCYNDPIKVKTLFLLPSYMRKSYVLGLLHLEN
ncbi:hypothetical protein Tco_1432637, partial [Tanacetum coccineum]